MEVLAGLFATAVAVAAFVPASVGSRSILSRTRHKELATLAASAILDANRAAGYNALALGTYTVANLPTQPDLINMSATETVILVDSSLQATGTDTGRKRVDVTVSWTNKGKDKGSVTVTSLIAND